MAEILRPVGGVGDLGSRAHHGFHVGGEIGKRSDEGIGAGAVAHRGEAAHLGADDEGIDAAGGLGEVGAVENEPAEGPFGGAGVDDALAGDGEVGDIGGADEGGDLGCGGAGLVGGAGLAGCGRDGDAAAPGVGGLAACAGVGVWQRVADRHVHEDEGRQCDGEAAGFQILDGVDDGFIRRRAAVGGAAVDQADEVRAATREAGDAPGERLGDLVGGIDAGAE